MVDVSKLQQGDAKAYKNFFEEYFKAFCTFAYGYVKNQDDAEDIVQDCLISFWDKRADFDNIYKIKSYLYVSIKNKAINFLRDRHTSSSDQLNDDYNFSEDDIIKNIIDTETYRMIYLAIDELPKQCKRIITMSIVGKKNKEIAQELGTSENTIHTLKKLAYKKLSVKLRNLINIFC